MFYDNQYVKLDLSLLFPYIRNSTFSYRKMFHNLALYQG